MLIEILVTLVSILAAVCSSSSESVKMLPTVSHSLVNLGKIDVSFNFYGNDPDSIDDDYKNHIPPFSSVEHPKSEIMVDLPCPCLKIQPLKTVLSHPSHIISKVLRNKDLFKESSSSLCCSSHKQVHEDVSFLKMGPNKNILKNNKIPIKRLFVDTLPKSAPLFKPKAVEMYLFPKIKDLTNFGFTKTAENKQMSKANITFFEDKLPHNDFKAIPETGTSFTNNLKETKDKTHVKDKEVININNIKTNTLDS